jgi:hypothetical protein
MRLVEKLLSKFCHRFSVPSNANGRCHSFNRPYKYQLIHLHPASSPSRQMSAISSFRAPGPIAIGGQAVYPDGNACFTCTPQYGHPREWHPKPDENPTRPRTLVLCFDGTGDSFDVDVSLPPSALNSVHTRCLSRTFTELQCRPFLGDVEER